MNKFCRQYISEVTSLFPIKGREERKYLKKLKSDISDYCEEVEVSSKEDLYTNYGAPEDVVHNYLSATDTAYIVKRIKTATYIKGLIIALIVSAVIATSAYCVYLYNMQQMHLRNEVVISKEIVKTDN